MKRIYRAASPGHAPLTPSAYATPSTTVPVLERDGKLNAILLVHGEATLRGRLDIFDREARFIDTAGNRHAAARTTPAVLNTITQTKRRRAVCP